MTVNEMTLCQKTALQQIIISWLWLTSFRGFLGFWSQECLQGLSSCSASIAIASQKTPQMVASLLTSLLIALPRPWVDASVISEVEVCSLRRHHRRRRHRLQNKDQVSGLLILGWVYKSNLKNSHQWIRFEQTVRSGTWAFRGRKSRNKVTLTCVPKS